MASDPLAVLFTGRRPYALRARLLRWALVVDVASVRVVIPPATLLSAAIAGVWIVSIVAVAMWLAG